MILLIRCKVCGDKPTRGTMPKKGGKGYLHYVGCQCGQVVAAETQELAAVEWNRANLPDEISYRHEKCIQCGSVQNVSVRARLIQGKVYICPQCEAKNRRTGHRAV